MKYFCVMRDEKTYLNTEMRNWRQRKTLKHLNEWERKLEESK